MIILGIDSSSVSGGVCVADNEQILSNGFVKNGLTHSQTLLPLISETVERSGKPTDDIDLISVTKWPGSFTGLRIGMATAKGIAAANNTKCVGVSSLEAAGFGVYLSDSYDLDGAVISAVMDARCKQVYNALFSISDGQFSRLCDDRALSIDELLCELKSMGKKVILVGDGAKLCYDSFGANIDCTLTDEQDMYVSGKSVALLGLKYAENAVKYDKLQPFYLRLPQAQRELKLKKGEKIK